MTTRLARPRYAARRLVGQLDEMLQRIGLLARFVPTAMLSTGKAVRNYKTETLRIIAEVSFGTGALAMIGGTVVIVSFLTLFAGATVAVQGYHTLGNIGVDALTGFVSSYINIRVVVPVTAGVGLAATLGASTTAELGAMRISEEIDALESMGIRSLPYLIGTRLLAGIAVITPIYALSMLTAFLASRVATVSILGQSSGVYDHYFETFLVPGDVGWSFFQAFTMALAVMGIHSFYGYTASGGPGGVGIATGRAVRLSLVVVVTITLVTALALYGSARQLRLAG